MKKPVPMALFFEADMDAESNLTGKCKLGPFGKANFTGTPVKCRVILCNCLIERLGNFT